MCVLAEEEEKNNFLYIEIYWSLTGLENHFNLCDISTYVNSSNAKFTILHAYIWHLYKGTKDYTDLYSFDDTSASLSRKCSVNTSTAMAENRQLASKKTFSLSRSSAARKSFSRWYASSPRSPMKTTLRHTWKK